MEIAMLKSERDVLRHQVFDLQQRLDGKRGRGANGSWLGLFSFSGIAVLWSVVVGNSATTRRHKYAALHDHGNAPQNETRFQPFLQPPDRKVLRQALAQNKVFASFGPAQLDAAAAIMEEVWWRREDIVIREGDTNDDLFYVMGSGEFSVLKGERIEPVHVYTAAGDSFGELAFKYGRKRNATIRCEVAGCLWSLSRAQYKTIIEQRHDYQ